MEKLLVILGPTATGKTSLGLYLAGKFKGEIISADSRQVYRNLDIGTGKDVPAGSRKKESVISVTELKSAVSYLSLESGVNLWGYDLVGPKEEFSVASFVNFAERVIADIKARGKLPIVVGGTGLYIRAVLEGIKTLGIDKNVALRSSLEERNVEELYELLSSLDPIRAASMNVSDKKNPRRLVRAIEVADATIRGGKKGKEFKERISRDVLKIGLRAERIYLNDKIEKRVEERLKKGFLEEVKMLLDLGVTFNDQAFASLGYKQFENYFKKKEPLETAKNKWIREEQRYAKRQFVWFKKEKDVDWFDASSKNLRQLVEKRVQAWYKEAYAD